MIDNTPPTDDRTAQIIWLVAVIAPLLLGFVERNFFKKKDL